MDRMWKENDESVWGSAVETLYAGRRTGSTYSLSAVAGALDVKDCRAMPSTLELACKKEMPAIAAQKR